MNENQKPHPTGNAPFALCCALLLAVFLTGGCGVIEKIRPSASKNTFGGSIAGDLERQTYLKKYNAYMECFNNVDNRVENYYERYASGPQKFIARGKDDAEDSRIQVSIPSNVFYDMDEYQRKYVTALRDAVDAKPAIDGLDEAGRQYVAAFDKLDPLAKEAESYYRQRNYKDDNFAKAREMDGPLVAAFKEFRRAAGRMGDELDKQEDALRQNQLNELSAGGKERGESYHLINLYVQAKKLYKAGRADEITAASFAPAFDGYAKAHEEAMQYVNANAAKSKNLSKAIKESLIGPPAPEQFLTAGKEMGRLLREGKKLPERGPGSREGIGSAYNTLINSLNSVTRSMTTAS